VRQLAAGRHLDTIDVRRQRAQDRLRVYAKCTEGQDEAAKRRIEAALRD
jgi:hypothetical protein